MDALTTKIAQVAATRLCRFCSQPVPHDAVICACRVERGELPHTEWGADVKEYLITRMIERRMWNGSEHEMWARMVTGLYAGTIQGTGTKRVVLPRSVSIIEALPFAMGDGALWSASGSPRLYTI